MTIRKMHCLSITVEEVANRRFMGANLFPTLCGIQVNFWDVVTARRFVDTGSSYRCLSCGKSKNLPLLLLGEV